MTSYTPTLEEMRGWKKPDGPKYTWFKTGSGTCESTRWTYYDDGSSFGDHPSFHHCEEGDIVSINLLTGETAKPGCGYRDADGYCPINLRPPSTTLHSCDEEVEKVQPPPFRMRGYIAHPIKPRPHMAPNKIDSKQYVGGSPTGDRIWEESIPNHRVDCAHIACGGVIDCT